MKRLGLALVLIAAACGNTTEKDGDNVVVVNNANNANSSANNTPVPSDQCVTRCGAKLTSCEFPGDAMAVCAQQLCAGALTTSELECLEAASCQELAAADATFCQDASNSSNPNSNANNNPNSTPNNDNSSNPNSTPNNEPANSDEGGSCMCDPHPDYMGDELIYAYCEGTETGCKYDIFGDGPKLGCLYEYESGNGACSYTCGADDEGTQGSCPDGYTCQNSGHQSLTGTFWYECSN